MNIIWILIETDRQKYYQILSLKKMEKCVFLKNKSKENTITALPIVIYYLYNQKQK